MKMTTANKELVQRWFDDVWNRSWTESIDELFAADGLAHGLSEGKDVPLKGAADFKVFHRKFKDAFPDLTVDVVDMVAEGDKVAARCAVKGKHEGDSLGIAATKAPVDFEGITIVRIKEGKIVEAWNHFDFARMYRQLGTL